jgi:hypothetical protein
VRTPLFTAWPKSVDRVIRYWAGSTSLDPACTHAGSRSERATALATAARHDGAASARAHTKPEPVHACTAPVVRLEGPLALGHGYISSVTPCVRVRHTHELPCGADAVAVPYERSSCLLAPARYPGVPGRCRIATCGRLFEGTDEISLGQTYSHRAASDLIRHTVHPRRAEVQSAPRNVAELLAPGRKTC